MSRYSNEERADALEIIGALENLDDTDTDTEQEADGQ